MVSVSDVVAPVLMGLVFIVALVAVSAPFLAALYLATALGATGLAKWWVALGIIVLAVVRL